MAEKVRDYGKLAADIKKEIGEENIVGATHCATRLRLTLKQSPSADVTKRISEMPAVIQVVEKGGQYQIVIGTHAKDVYAELAKILTIDTSAEQAEVKQGFFAAVIATMSAVFAPFVYILSAAGLIQGMLILITYANPAFAETGTYSVLSFISWTPFTFLPVMIAVTSARHFKCNMFIAMWCCLALVNPDWGSMAARIADGEVINFLVFPMSQTVYTSTVLPPLVLVLVLSYFERFLNKHLPDIIQPIFTPLICALVMVPLTILIIGPISDWAASGLAIGYNWLNDNIPILAALLVGGIWQVFVIFGIHWGVTPMVLANFALYGYDTFQAFQTCAVVAQAAACFGVFIRTKSKEMKSVSLSAGLTGIFGITEPAIYGVNLRLKRPFLFGCIGGAIGAVILTFFHTVYYVYAGLPGLLTIMNSIGDQFPNSFTGMLIGIAVTVVVTMLLIIIFGCDEKEPAAAAAGGGNVSLNNEGLTADAELIGMTGAEGAIDKGSEVTVYAPLNGEVKEISQVNDPTFAEGLLGLGAAIVPSEGKLYAPFDGTVASIPDSRHAINLEGPGGIEMLIHIGLDTVELNGTHFNPKVVDGQKFKRGDVLVEFDLKAIGEKYDTVTPVLVVNADDYDVVEMVSTSGQIKAGDPLLRVVK